MESNPVTSIQTRENANTLQLGHHAPGKSLRGPRQPGMEMGGMITRRAVNLTPEHRGPPPAIPAGEGRPQERSGVGVGGHTLLSSVCRDPLPGVGQGSWAAGNRRQIGLTSTKGGACWKNVGAASGWT